MSPKKKTKTDLEPLSFSKEMSSTSTKSLLIRLLEKFHPACLTQPARLRVRRLNIWNLTLLLDHLY